MRFGVLGPLTVHDDGGEDVQLSGPKQRLLLAVLLCRANRPVPIPELVGAVWGPGAPDGARTTLRWHAHQLRGVLGDRDRLTAKPSGYTLHVDDGELDAWRFEDLRRRGSAARAARDLECAVALFDEALREWRGPAFAEFTDAEAVRGTAVRLDELRLSTLTARIDAELDLGRHTELVTELSELSAAHPWSPRFSEQLMLALHRAGRTADALDAYLRARTRLVDELGIDPPQSLRTLHQRILRDDPELLPASCPGPPPATPAAVPRQLPAPLPGFTGRDEALEDLSAQFDAGGSLLLITGMAGVGKTATAVRWAHRVAKVFTDGQLFVDLRGYDGQAAMDPADVLALFLSALGAAGQDIPEGVDARTAKYRSLLGDRRMLVVLDNAADAAQVRPLLPGNPDCVTVVTSRDRLSGLIAREGARRVPLGVLGAHEAVTLLREILGAARVDAEPDAARRLVELCGALPLALRLAAADLADDPGRSLHDLAEDLAGKDRLDALAIADAPEAAVRAVFRHSYDTLPESARRLFRLLGLVPGPTVTPGAAAALAGWPRDRAADVLGTLASAHLISATGRDRFAMHDLMRQYARELAADESSAGRRLYDHYARSALHASVVARPDHRTLPPPESEPGALREEFADAEAANAWIQAEYANLRAAVVEAAEHGPPPYAWHIVDAMRNHLASRGALAEWTALATAGLKAAQAAGDAHGEAAMQHSLGWTAQRAGDLQSAMGHQKRALALFREAGDPRGEIDVLLHLAFAYDNLGRPEEAISLGEQALTVTYELGDDLYTARALDQLGAFHSNAGDLREAVRLLRAGVDMERRLGHEHLHLGNFTLALLNAGDLAEAREVAVEAITLARRTAVLHAEMVLLDNLALAGAVRLARRPGQPPVPADDARDLRDR